MIGHGISEDLRTNANRDNLNGWGKFCERQRRESLGGSGGMLPQKILKSEISLKTPFPALSSR